MRNNWGSCFAKHSYKSIHWALRENSKNAFDWSLFLFLRLCLSAFLYKCLYLSIYLSLSLLHRGGVWNINHATYVYKYFSRISRMIPINQHNQKPLPTSPYCRIILLIKIWMDAPTNSPPASPLGVENIKI